MNGRDNASALARAGELGALRWAVLQLSDDPCANHLLIIMGSRANRSWEFFMSLRKAAALMQCHPRTVQRKIEYLLRRRYLEDISDRHPRRRTKTYRLCPE